MQAEPDSRPTLITGWDGKIQNPFGNEFEKAIRSMPGGEKSLVILRKETDTFIQVAGHEESGYLLEYWENKQGHYCTAMDFPSHTVIHVFKSYAQGDETWRSSVSWEAMGEKSGVENQAKKKKPRFTKKGMMRLALVTVLFLLSCIIFTPLGVIMGGMVALIPGIFIYIDLNHQKLIYSLPAPLFTVLVNIILVVPEIVILMSLPWDDWLNFSLLIPLTAFSVLLFWWGRRLIYHIRLNREGIEVEPSRVWSEQYEAGGDGGPYSRTRIVYRYTNDQIGSREPFGGKPVKRQLCVRYWPDRPGVHRLIQRRQSL